MPHNVVRTVASWGLVWKRYGGYWRGPCDISESVFGPYLSIRDTARTRCASQAFRKVVGSDQPLWKSLCLRPAQAEIVEIVVSRDWRCTFAPVDWYVYCRGGYHRTFDTRASLEHVSHLGQITTTAKLFLLGRVCPYSAALFGLVVE